MKVIKLVDNIYIFIFSNQYDMTSTFFRIQEFYESPSNEIRGKYFTLEKAIDTYTKLTFKDKKENIFTYFQDWHGFNIPGNIANKFLFKFGLHFDLLNKEIKFFKTFIQDIFKNRNKYYLIGVVENDKESLKHELAHAFYYLYPEYKDQMLKLINENHPMIDIAKKHLLEIGYNESVLEDEIQAYFATGLRRQMIPKSILDIKFLNKFKKIFKTEIQKHGKNIGTN